MSSLKSWRTGILFVKREAGIVMNICNSCWYGNRVWNSVKFKGVCVTGYRGRNVTKSSSFTGSKMLIGISTIVFLRAKLFPSYRRGLQPISTLSVLRSCNFNSYHPLILERCVSSTRVLPRMRAQLTHSPSLRITTK